VEFEWDGAKASSNRAKHGISFEEALTVFDDPLAAIFDDEEHSDRETREILIGHSDQHRLIVVCFTERSERVRIISARPATRRERDDYEENARVSFR
jgi:uncharacterized DUF497 family protein